VAARFVPDAGAAQAHHEASPETPALAQQILAEPNVSSWLDPYYDQYLTWKERFQKEYNIEYSLQASILPQWGTPKSGSAGMDFVWTPTIAWKPFTDTTAGSGVFTFSVQQNQFWNSPNTTTFQNRAGLLSPPSDWGVNTTDYAQLAYTHTLPGKWDWLSVTIGQYSFALYEVNQFAVNAQTNFISYALAQNATQAYVSADLGAYARAAAPGCNLVFAGGFHKAPRISLVPRSRHTGSPAVRKPISWRRNGRRTSSPADPTASFGTPSRRCRKRRYSARVGCPSTRCRTSMRDGAYSYGPTQRLG
jgi:hypothetical protein